MGARFSAWVACGLALGAAAPPPAAVIDGRVADLNAATYAAFQAIKQRNPGSLTEKDAKELAAAIMSDGKVDAAEIDLLTEMTQSQFRNIRVFAVGTAPTSDQFVQTFPTVGNAKKVLLNVLNPAPDLPVEWAKPDHGWNTLVADYKSSPAREAAVLGFVAGEMAKKWEASNMGNGYKPLRDEIANIYGLSNRPGSDTATGKMLLYRAVHKVDDDAQGQVPDLLYNWIRPGGAL